MKRLLSTVGGRAALLVTCVQLWVLVRWSGTGLFADDVSYLSSLEAITGGLEAPRPMRHLTWGLLHEVGHLPLDPAGWARGEPGAALQACAALLVAWTAWVVWRLALGLGLGQRVAAIAAVLASTAPATLLLAGQAGSLPRWLALGTGLLAIGTGAGALRGMAALSLAGPDRSVEAGILRRILLRRRLAVTLLLFGISLAWHPCSAGLLAVAALVWAHAIGAGRGRDVRRLRATAGGLWAGCLLLAMVWIQASGQQGMASVGARSLASALWAKPATGAIQLTWALPGAGWLSAGLPHGVTVAVGCAVIVALLVWRVSRPCGLLAAGGCLALIPEAAALAYVPDLALAWTPTSAGASMAPVAASSIAAALLLSRLRGPAWLITAVLLAGVVSVRGHLLIDLRQEPASRDSALQRLVGHELMAGMASSNRRLTIVGDVEELSRPLRSLKWIPELPEERRRVTVLTGPRPVAAYGLAARGMGVEHGLDPAFWTMASIRCELRLGLPRDPARSCRVPRLRDKPTARTCTLDLSTSPPGVRCPAAPEPLGAGPTRDPRARGWALLALLLLSGVGYLGGGGRRELVKA